MMRKSKTFTVIFIMAVSISLIGIGAIAASNYGSSEDPLVTLSYLTQVLTPSLLDRTGVELNDAVDKLNASVDELSAALEASQDARGFVTVELGAGESLSISGGVEFLLRSGEAFSAGTFINLTAGEDSADGNLVANNLYLAVGSGSGIAAATDCLLMIRGA